MDVRFYFTVRILLSFVMCKCNCKYRKTGKLWRILCLYCHIYYTVGTYNVQWNISNWSKKLSENIKCTSNGNHLKFFSLLLTFEVNFHQMFPCNTLIFVTYEQLSILCLKLFFIFTFKKNLDRTLRKKKNQELMNRIQSPILSVTMGRILMR